MLGVSPDTQIVPLDNARLSDRFKWIPAKEINLNDSQRRLNGCRDAHLTQVPRAITVQARITDQQESGFMKPPQPLKLAAGDWLFYMEPGKTTGPYYGKLPDNKVREKFEF